MTVRAVSVNDSAWRRAGGLRAGRDGLFFERRQVETGAKDAVNQLN
jgi:hypothetical protein